MERAFAAGQFLFYREHNAKAALKILKSAQACLDAKGQQAGPWFLLLAANCAKRIGERDLQISLLEKGLALQSEDKKGLTHIAAEYATAVLAQEDPEKAIASLKEALTLFEQQHDEISRAVTLGQIRSRIRFCASPWHHRYALRVCVRFCVAPALVRNFFMKKSEKYRFY